MDEKFVEAEQPKDASVYLIIYNPLLCFIIKILATGYNAHDYSDQFEVILNLKKALYILEIDID